MSAKKAELSDRVTALKGVCAVYEYAEISILFNAWKNALQAYQEDFSASRKKDFDAAREGLLQTLDNLEAHYFSPASRTAAPGHADPVDVLFRNSTEMFDTLNERGWGIKSRQTLTNHAKNGSLQLQPDRSITARAFLAWKNHPEGGQRYYENYVRAKRDELGTIEENALKKSAEEPKKIQIANRAALRAEQLELGRLITREESDRAVCAWTGLLRDTIASHIGRALPAIIHATGGHIAALAEATALVDQAIDDACNSIADSDGIDVIIDADPDKEDAA